MGFLTLPIGYLQQRIRAINASGELAIAGAGVLIPVAASINAAGQIVLSGGGQFDVVGGILNASGELTLKGAAQLVELRSLTASGQIVLSGGGQLVQVRSLSASGAIALEGFSQLHPIQAGSPLVADYVTAVEAVGGTVSTAAQSALEAFLYANYDNGNAGTGNVASFISDFQYLWIPLSDTFAGAIICIVGSNINNGFVSGDYDQAVGLQGDGVSDLTTQLQLVDIDMADSSAYISADTTGIGTSIQMFMGASQGYEAFDFYSSSSILGRISATNQRIATFSASNTNTRFFWNAPDTSTLIAYERNLEEKVAAATSHTTPFSSPNSIRIFSRSGSYKTNAVIRLAAIGRSLTAEKRTILDNAAAALDIARIGL